MTITKDLNSIVVWDLKIYSEERKKEDKGPNMPGHTNPPNPPEKQKIKKEKMKVDKVLNKFREKHAKAVEDCKGEVEVITLERKKHFKGELSNPNGFGFQDLKKKPRKMITTLMTEGFDLAFTPMDISKENFKVKVTAKK